MRRRIIPDEPVEYGAHVVVRQLKGTGLRQLQGTGLRQLQGTSSAGPHTFR